EVGKGSGLGLSMVYGFVKQSNGHVSIYSEPGLGTTVRLYLPAARSGETPKGAPAVVPRDEAPHGRETVLLAEDDAFVRAYAVSCLDSLGYRVIAAVDGQEALTRLNQGETPDLLFTDIVMPGGISGWELVERAQRMRPGLKVLLASGSQADTMADPGQH